MPIQISYYHFLHNLLNILVRRFNNSVHLWAVWRRIMVLDLEGLTNLLHHLVVKIRPIIYDNLVGNLVTADDILLDKTSDHLFGDACIGCCFNPLSKVVYSNQNEAMSVGRYRFNLSDHINAP